MMYWLFFLNSDSSLEVVKIHYKPIPAVCVICVLLTCLLIKVFVSCKLKMCFRHYTNKIVKEAFWMCFLFSLQGISYITSSCSLNGIR